MKIGMDAVQEEPSALKKKKRFFWMVAVMILILGMIYVPQVVTVTNSVNGKELPIYCVETEEKKAALTFDAAWGQEDLKAILEILEEKQVHVTFFMTGEWVEKFPEEVKAIAAAGHDLGNHGENHKNMSQLNNESCQNEILKVHEKIKKLTGIRMELFRPPFGDYADHVITSASALGYYSIQWSVDSLDWKDYGVESIIDTVLNHKNLENGAIILLHNGAKYTQGALERVIDGLQEKGYDLVPVSELIYREDYHLDHTGKQIRNH